MSEIVTAIEKYGRTRYRVVIGTHTSEPSGRSINHLYDVKPGDWYSWPSGDIPQIVWLTYHEHLRGFDEEQRERVGFVHGWGWLTEGDYAAAVVAEQTDLVEYLDALRAFEPNRTFLRGVDLGRGLRPNLRDVLVGTSQERQTARLTAWLERQAAATQNPTPPEALRDAAAFIIEQVEATEV